MKQKVVLIFAIITGIMAAFISGSIIFAKRAELERERLAMRNIRRTQVVVLKESLPSGAIVRRDMLGIRSFEDAAIAKRAIRVTDENKSTLASQLDGRKLVAHVEAGTPLLWTDLQGGSLEDGGLASSLARGMRAISISVGSNTSVSNMIRPSDHVDVLGTFTLPSKTRPGETEVVTLTILQNVLVLATGQETTQTYSGVGSRYNLITLEVSQSEAEVIAFTEQMRGRLTLTLRNPTDTTHTEKLPSVNFDEIRSKLEEMNKKRHARSR